MHAILIHGWTGHPGYAWFPWLRRELEAKGWTTEAPQMPSPYLPKREQWVKTIRSLPLGSDTVLVGHSLGCPAILWSLEEYIGPPLAKVVLVSGFCRPYPSPLILEARADWFPREIDMASVKKTARAWSVVHAKLDPLVSFQEGEHLAYELGVPLIVTKRVGHLLRAEGAAEVPEILDAVLGA